MSDKEIVKSHPLEFNSLDDNDEFNFYRTKSTNSSASISISSNSNLNHDAISNWHKLKLEAESNLKIQKIKPLKRIAPKRPDELIIDYQIKQPILADENKISNFYIEIDQVRWFYKGDKETSINQPNQTASATSLQTVQSSSNLLSEQNPSLVSNENDINNNSNNNSNTCSGSINLTSKKWQMFSKYDSYNIEIEYRDMISKKNLNIQSEPKLVQVLENLYEVNLETKKCYPIYWKVARTMSVMRCIWYTDSGEPFEERVGEEIEKKHVELFKDLLLKPIETESLNYDYVDKQPISPAELPISLNDEPILLTNQKPVKTETSNKAQIESIGSLQFDDGIITWYSKDEVFWEKTKLNLLNIMSSKFKFRNKFAGVKIKRGLKEKLQKENEQEEKPSEITHLIFVIHGIAQKLYENSIIKNCDDLRKECEKKKREYFSANKNHRYIFIPVDWRSSLTLDDGIVESITPKSIQMIRDKLNSSALDIMYYTSPLFRTEIMSSLTSEMNRLYNLFCQKNPYFKKKYNKVSFVAHSLGTVIVYDIITSNYSYTQFTNSYGEDLNQEKQVFNHFSHNNSNLLNEYLQCKKRMQEIEKNLVITNNNTGLLEFKAENFFLLGSPLAVFLALRGVRPAGIGNQDHILPRHICKRLFNIFHPSDPIAYRLEPLVLKTYATKSPLEIQKASDPNSAKASYKEMNEKRTGLNIDLKSTLTKVSNKKKDKIDSKSAELNQIKDETTVRTSPTENKFQKTIDQVELETAFDYQLQESNFELMATLRAHTCYWKSSDTALFIMQQLCLNDNETNEIVSF